jgi:ribosomal protein S18 acetylase RimI-like enzyme
MSFTCPRDSNQVFFNHKAHTIAVAGGKGTVNYKRRISPEYAEPCKRSKKEEDLTTTFEPADDITKGGAIMLLECGFHESVHATIRQCVTESWPNNTSNTLCAKIMSSSSMMDAVVVFRKVAVHDMLMYEVLFLSVHPNQKRHGVGRTLVKNLLKKVSSAPWQGRKMMTVSLKSASSEAAHFWESIGMRAMCDDPMEKHMVGFDDFCGFGMNIDS